MSISSYIRRHSLVVLTITIVLILVIFTIIRNSNSVQPESKNVTTKKVTLVNVASFRQGNDFVGGNGVVETRGQADLKSQMSAPVASIHGGIGDAVYSGQTILELENSDIRAQLEQARASLALAEGQYFTGGVSLDSAKSGAVDKIRDSYLKAFEAVNVQIDPLLNNNDGNRRRLSVLVADWRLNDNILITRIDLDNIFREWDKLVNSLSTDSSSETILSAIKVSSKNLATVDTLLRYVSQGLNDIAEYADPTLSTFLNTWKPVVSGARASISGASQALTGVEASLSGAGASYNKTALAQVSAAKAGVNNLEAQLSKTIIRSPITGKIAGLPLRVGELASPGQLLATVVGDSGLEIKAYVSGEDLSRIKVGADVSIQENIKGVVESVAPSVSSVNRKAEIIISIKDEDISKLVIGQNVRVSIQASKDQNISSTNSNQRIIYSLPIQDIKIVPGDAYVFTVDENSAIRRNQVILGQVKGDFIEVVGGLSDDMNIVSPVYELDEGENVTSE